MARLIDADALEADLRRQYDEVFGNARKTVNPDDFYIERVAAYKTNVVEAEQKGFFEYLKTRPTVNVVFCKDCRYSRPINRKDSYENSYIEECIFCIEHDKGKLPDDYCSDGVRRDDK